MGSSFSDGTSCGETFLFVAILGTVLALAGLGTVRCIPSAVWRRLVWRIVVLTGILICLLEWTGMGRATIGWWTQRMASAEAKSAAKWTDTSSLESSHLSTERFQAEIRDAGNMATSYPEKRESEQAAMESLASEKEQTVAENQVPKNHAMTVADGTNEEVSPTEVEDLGVITEPIQATDFRTARSAREVANRGVANREVADREPVQDLFSGMLGFGEPVLVGAGHATDWRTWILSVLGLLWFFLALVLLGWTILNRLALIWFRSYRMQSAPAEMEDRVRCLAELAGLRIRIQLGQAAGLRVPVAFGIVWPTLCLSGRFQEDLEPAAQDAVLAHEVAHLAARDPFWFLFADVWTAILWWHPAAWWIRRQLHVASESVADEASALLPGGPGDLAAALVILGKRLTLGRHLAWLTVTGTHLRSSLAFRINRLLRFEQTPTPHRLTTGGWGMVVQSALPFVIVFGILLGIAWARPHITRNQGEETMSYLTRSWRQSLAAATFAALFVSNTPPASADEPIADRRPELAVAIDADAAVVPAAFSEEKRERIEGRQRQMSEAFEAMNRTIDEIENEIPRMKEHGKQAIEELLRKLRDDSISEEKRQEIQEKIENMKGRIERAVHEAVGRADAVREKRHQLELEKRELHQQMFQGEMESLRHQLKRLDQERRRLGDRSPDQAHALELRQQQVKQQLAELERMQVDRRLDDHRQKLEQVHHEIEALRGQGKMDRAEAMAQRARAMEEQLHAMEREFDRRRDDRPRGGDEFARRLEHIRIAAENLHAAGLHDQAEMILREGEVLLHADRERGRAMREEHRPRDRGPEAREREREPVEHLQDQIHELQEQMGQVREEIGDIHRFLEQIARGERDRD